jgi:hypothetical protein
MNGPGTSASPTVRDENGSEEAERAKDDICGSWGLAGAPAPAAGSWA